MLTDKLGLVGTWTDTSDEKRRAEEAEERTREANRRRRAQGVFETLSPFMRHAHICTSRAELSL